MKTKITFLLTALLLTLFSINANAQSNTTPIKGDVNGDGKVDVADIVAIIEIMKNGGGTSGETTYYWYVGQTNPLTMTSISPMADDTVIIEDQEEIFSSGWRLIGTTLPTYSPSNQLWDGHVISTGTTKATNYVALPNSTLFMYDSLGNISDAGWTSQGTKTIDGVTYYIYSSVANLKSFGFNIY